MMACLVSHRGTNLTNHPCDVSHSFVVMVVARVGRGEDGGAARGRNNSRAWPDCELSPQHHNSPHPPPPTPQPPAPSPQPPAPTKCVEYGMYYNSLVLLDKGSVTGNGNYWASVIGFRLVSSSLGWAEPKSVATSYILHFGN